MNNKIIARSHNEVYSKNDKLAHAEMIALQKIKKTLLKNKNKVRLYTTYEHCPMCFGACILSRIRKIVCG
jgi:tRNA(Arg) A34 adenosine deaminase TadA